MGATFFTSNQEMSGFWGAASLVVNGVPIKFVKTGCGSTPEDP